jgi:hypothetical protein
MYLFKKKSPTPAAAARNAPIDVESALDEAKIALSALDATGFLRTQSLIFAQSLLTSVGENPDTPQNQLLIHQMAIENLRSREAILNGPRR